MTVSEMTKNDMDAIEHMLSGKDSICGKCGVYVDPSRCMWSTCAPADKMYTCKICSEKKDKESSYFRCPKCGTTKSSPGLCGDCEAGRCYVVYQHKNWDPFWRYNWIRHSSMSWWEKLEKQMDTCVGCIEFRQQHPFDYDWMMWKDLMRKTHHMVTHKKRCEWCNRRQDRPHTLEHHSYDRWRGEDGWMKWKNLYTCNSLYDDLNDCYVEWATENNQLCPVTKDGHPCRIPLGHAEIPMSGPEYWHSENREDTFHRFNINGLHVLERINA